MSQLNDRNAFANESPEALALSDDLNATDLSDDRIRQILTSDVAAEVVRKDIGMNEADLDTIFQPSGPGGFWRLDLARHSLDGSRIKMHLFSGMDTGPHSHSTRIVSAIHKGSIINRLFVFQANPQVPEYAEEHFTNAAHLDRSTKAGEKGELLKISEIEHSRGEVYGVEHGAIHTSEPNPESYALTLCYFGPLIAPGARYLPVVPDVEALVESPPSKIISGIREQK